MASNYFDEFEKRAAKGAVAAADGKTIHDCPYADDTESDGWLRGFREYHSEKSSIEQGFLVYFSTHLDGHGWKVPLADAVECGRFVPKYVSLPDGLVAHERVNYGFDIKSWDGFIVSDPLMVHKSS